MARNQRTKDSPYKFDFVMVRALAVVQFFIIVPNVHLEEITAIVINNDKCESKLVAKLSSVRDHLFKEDKQSFNGKSSDR